MRVPIGSDLNDKTDTEDNSETTTPNYVLAHRNRNAKAT
jgi:hypothetical protein